MGKIMAQRKFAQGVYVPPSVPNGNVDRKQTDLSKDPKNIIRRKTNAKTLLDVVSLENIHKHNPVVLLERLKNVDAVEDTIVPEENSLLKPIESISVAPKPRAQVPVARRKPLIQRRMYTRSGGRKIKKKSNTGHKVKRRRNPIRKAAFTASLLWKYTASVDNDYSVDDDRPLTYFTRSNNVNQSRQNCFTSEPTNNNLGPKSKSTCTDEPANLPSVSYEPSTAVEMDPAQQPSENDDGDSEGNLAGVDYEIDYNHLNIYIDDAELRTEQDFVNAEETEVVRPESSISQSCRNEEVSLEKMESKSPVRRSRSRSYGRTPSEDGVRPGPSKRLSRYEAHMATKNLRNKERSSNCSSSNTDSAQPGPSGIRSRGKGKAKKTSKNISSQIDKEEAGPSGLQKQHVTLESPSRADSSVTAEESVDSEVPEQDAYINNRVQHWVDSTVFKVPKVPKARTRQSSPHPSYLEYAGLRRNPRGRSGSSSSSVRTRSDRSLSPISIITALDNPDQPLSTVIDAETEITVPTRRERTLVHPRRKRPRLDTAKLVNAPSFRPTEEEFQDPIAYFEKIMPTAVKYGICKVVAPPGFKPQCNLNDAMRFNVFNQYITRMFRRWGAGTREMCAMRTHLATLKIACAQPPLLGGMEFNLPKLYHAVNNNGGLKNINKKTWAKVAEEINCGKMSHPDRRLDQLYMKYVLSYNALGKRERHVMLKKVEELWQKRYKKMLDRASNPLHRQKHLLGESDSSDEENDDDEKRYPHLTKQLKEAEECITKGRHMDLITFKRIASNSLKRHFPKGASVDSIENSYWTSALIGADHVCVHSASIETSSEGYGFTNKQNEPYGNHPWNLKMLNQNTGNILRLLGSVVGLTIPTLHLGMLFSTSCWHRDPHGLPWMEYMHEGPRKIWYGIPDEESERFRKAVETLCPTSYQNKPIWLPSDITMIPPNLLLEHNVSMSRVLQKPGEFVIVFPKAYSCSICTGYTVSESVYFATNYWINNISQVFQELRESCEPSMFSLEQLLISAASDPRAKLTMLQLVHSGLSHIVDTELKHRAGLIKCGLKPRHQAKVNPTGVIWNISEEDECEICRTTLYLSRVNGVFHVEGALCVGHALQVLEDKSGNISRRDQNNYEFITHYTDDELKDIIKRSQDRFQWSGQSQRVKCLNTPS